MRRLWRRQRLAVVAMGAVVLLAVLSRLVGVGELLVLAVLTGMCDKPRRSRRGR